MPAITYTLTSSFFTCWLCQAEFDLNDEVVLHAACKANSHAECLDWWADQSQQNQNQDIQCQCREVIGVADVDVPGEPTPERQMDRDDAATREQDEQELAVVEVVDLAFEDDRPPTSPPSTDAGVCRMAQEVPENLEAANLTQEAMPTEPATSREVAMSLSPPNLLVQDQPGQLRLLDLKDEVETDPRATPATQSFSDTGPALQSRHQPSGSLPAQRNSRKSRARIAKPVASSSLGSEARYPFPLHVEQSRHRNVVASHSSGQADPDQGRIAHALGGPCSTSYQEPVLLAGWGFFAARHLGRDSPHGVFRALSFEGSAVAPPNTRIVEIRGRGGQIGDRPAKVRLSAFWSECGTDLIQEFINFHSVLVASGASCCVLSGPMRCRNLKQLWKLMSTLDILGEVACKVLDSVLDKLRNRNWTRNGGAG
ncbi:uncharacterized protein BKA78DRAFT_290932 [Phyllosticta capitalensis]|uniref:uncharacterized protein n=1 Tax=Phyllosticta capitalensis TaxID=121624 RepID=UPI00312FC454